MQIAHSPHSYIILVAYEKCTLNLLLSTTEVK